MAIPQNDLDRIQLWTRERIPEEQWDELRVEADVSQRHVDIVEVGPPWDGIGEEDRTPIARLRYTAKTGLWSIYWCDRNMRFHAYKDFEPTQQVQEQLDWLVDSGDPIFWG